MAVPNTKRAPRKTPGAPKSRTTPAKATGSAAAWSIGAVALAAGAGLVAFLTRGRIAAMLATREGHVPTDLLDPDHKPGDRAPGAFRPDMDAPMTAAERAALAPATGPAPSLVADRGSMNSQT